MQFPDHSVAFLEENPRLSDTATPPQACGCDVSTSPWTEVTPPSHSTLSDVEAKRAAVFKRFQTGPVPLPLFGKAAPFR